MDCRADFQSARNDNKKLTIKKWILGFRLACKRDLAPLLKIAQDVIAIILQELFLLHKLYITLHHIFDKHC